MKTPPPADWPVLGITDTFSPGVKYPRLHVRQVPTVSHEVVDLLRPLGPALVVCIKCGATWDEGGIPAAACK